MSDFDGEKKQRADVLFREMSRNVCMVWRNGALMIKRRHTSGMTALAWTEMHEDDRHTNEYRITLSFCPLKNSHRDEEIQDEIINDCR